MIRIAPRVYLAPAPGPSSAGTGVAGPGQPVPAGSLVLPQLTSQAFGDGTHPTTRLCARAVDLVCRQRRPRAVLDIGSGTGVLARIARAHGAVKVVATDLDKESLRIIPLNAALDEGAPALEVHDARRCTPDAWGPVFDLVVANILEDVLVCLAPALAGALAPGAALLLSGFTAPQAPRLRALYGEVGLQVDVQAHDGEWTLLELSRHRRTE